MCIFRHITEEKTCKHAGWGYSFLNTCISKTTRLKLKKVRQECMAMGPICIKKLQNYWVFGLFLSSIIVGTRKYDILETGSVSVLRREEGGKTPTQLGPLDRANLNHWRTQDWTTRGWK
jgi:hypothetical protein